MCIMCVPCTMYRIVPPCRNFMCEIIHHHDTPPGKDGCVVDGGRENFSQAFCLSRLPFPLLFSLFALCFMFYDIFKTEALRTLLWSKLKIVIF